jgi:fido (protein-threonine AMPylation protein)
MANESGVGPELPRLNQNDDARFAREIQSAKLIDSQQEIAKRLARERRRPQGEAPVADDLKILHQNLFQGLYAEPGNYRGIRTGPESEDVTTETGRETARGIGRRVDAIFEEFKRQNYRFSTKEGFVDELTELIYRVNEVDPFYYGTRLVTLVMAGHVADYAGYRSDLLKADTEAMRKALDAAEQHQDLVPLRAIVRDQTRPFRAVVFEQAISAGKLPNIDAYPDLKHAYGLVVEAMGPQIGKGSQSEFALRSVDKEIIRKIQTELDAGRLTTMPTGAERTRILNRSRGPTR